MVVEVDINAVDVDGLTDVGSGEDEIEEKVREGGGGEGAGLVEDTSIAVVILVVSTLVIVGAPIVGGSAEENAFEPGVRRDVAIGTTVRASCVGLIARGTFAQIEKIPLST